VRAFFALEVPAQTREAIARWRLHAVPRLRRAVASENFHITVHFLGNLQERHLDSVCAQVDTLRVEPFDLCLDTSGYFPGSGIFWIGPGVVATALPALVKALREVSRNSGLNTSHRAYHPHLTLFRNCRSRPPRPSPVPDFHIPCNGFTLFESTDPSGAHYTVLRRWHSA